VTSSDQLDPPQAVRIQLLLLLLLPMQQSDSHTKTTEVRHFIGTAAETSATHFFPLIRELSVDGW